MAKKEEILRTKKTAVLLSITFFILLFLYFLKPSYLMRALFIAFLLCYGIYFYTRPLETLWGKTLTNKKLVGESSFSLWIMWHKKNKKMMLLLYAPALLILIAVAFISLGVINLYFFIFFLCFISIIVGVVGVLLTYNNHSIIIDSPEYQESEAIGMSRIFNKALSYASFLFFVALGLIGLSSLI